MEHNTHNNNKHNFFNFQRLEKYFSQLVKRMVEPIPPTPPDIDGYLSKLKHKQSFFGSWNKRYFLVNSQTKKLEYYTTKPTNSSQKPSGEIDLNLIQSIRNFDDNAFQVFRFLFF